MSTDRKITIIAVLVLLCYIGVDVGFKIKDKIAQARVDGANQVREQSKKEFDAQLDARQKQYDTDKAKQDKEIADARKSVAEMAALVNRQVPGAPTPIKVNAGAPYTVTLRTGDAVIPAESAPAYFDAFEAGQSCQTDLKKCVGDKSNYMSKYTITQAQFDDEKKIKKRSKWGVVGQAACSGGGAYLGSLMGKEKGAALGAGIAGGFCGFKF
jgi:hypothetical protein